jgi:glycosyltransferase involved in cell wall biosynthesis
MPQIKVLAIIASMAQKHGGTTFSVASLCEASAAAGVRQSLITIQAPEGVTEHLPSPELVETIRISGLHFSALRLFWSPSFKSAVRSYCREHRVQVIHSHGIWTIPNLVAASVARELGLPLVVSTHGMLEPWAWRYHAWKKRPVWWLWECRNLCRAAVLQTTAQKEVVALRAIGLRNPAAIIPIGVDAPPAHQSGKRSGVRTALFFSRIHPTKGLINLVKAWSQVRPAGWQMVVCGPDESGHSLEVKRAVAKAGLSEVFDFRPPVYGPEKETLYASADLFVLPTFTENFGIVIAEALASGVPVITTKGAPWAELPARQCGWWVDIGVEPLAAALREATSLSDPQRQAMGQRGRRFVEENYSWPKIGREMFSVYSWILGQGPQPPCVRLREYPLITKQWPFAVGLRNRDG